VSPAIVDEVLRGLRYPKVTKYIRPEIAEAWFTGIVLLADLIAGDYVLSGVSEDPDDDKYLAAAVEGRATRPVTGDPDLLRVGEHAGVRIVNRCPGVWPIFPRLAATSFSNIRCGRSAGRGDHARFPRAFVEALRESRRS
jgi:hypothetical protein